MAQSNPGTQTPKKEAPDLDIVDDMFDNPREEVVAMARQELGEKANGWHFCFFREKDSKNGKRLERLGYTPVIIDGEQVSHGGDLLWACAETLYKRRMSRSAREAVEMLQDTIAGARDEYPGVRNT